VPPPISVRRSTRFVLGVTVETLTRSVDAGSRRNAWQALVATQAPPLQPDAPLRSAGVR
jgi:hypothetical protein